MTIQVFAILLFGYTLTGWLVFQLLLWLLFRPTLVHSFARIRIQGILPALRPILIKKGSEWIQTNGMAQLKLQELISSPSNIEKLLPLIESHIDNFLRHKLPQEMPMVSMFVGEKTIGKLKDTFLQEIAAMLPVLLLSFVQNFEKNVDVRPLLQKVLDAYPDTKLEDLVKKTFAKEIRAGGILAAWVGLLIGLLQVAVLLML